VSGFSRLRFASAPAGHRRCSWSFSILHAKCLLIDYFAIKRVATGKKKAGNCVFYLFIICISVAALVGVFSKSSGSGSSSGTYVKPSMTRSGQFRKGHYRKSVSTDKDAFNHRQQSKSYYHRKGKYMRKKKSN
jgi:hypothetical protein